MFKKYGKIPQRCVLSQLRTHLGKFSREAIYLRFHKELDIIDVFLSKLTNNNKKILVFSEFLCKDFEAITDPIDPNVSQKKAELDSFSQVPDQFDFIKPLIKNIRPHLQMLTVYLILY